jgi:hypothetical protein
MNAGGGGAGGPASSQSVPTRVVAEELAFDRGQCREESPRDLAAERTSTSARGRGRGGLKPEGRGGGGGGCLSPLEASGGRPPAGVMFASASARRRVGVRRRVRPPASVVGSRR